tara:strand:- start:53 stop:448 length:396 start_codon:yes stop_codon:yes gene_type:complete
METLLASGKTVLLETGGHIDISNVPHDVVKVLDVKCPGSGEVEHNDLANLNRLAKHDEVKFVIRDRSDYEFARALVHKYALEDCCAAVLFSPVHRVLDPDRLSEWTLADRLPVRIQVQLHKYLWGDEVRGV